MQYSVYMQCSNGQKIHSNATLGPTVHAHATVQYLSLFLQKSRASRVSIEITNNVSHNVLFVGSSIRQCDLT